MDTIVRLPPWRRASEVMSTLSARERDWGLNQFGIPEAWKLSRGKGVRIAVLDTGVDAAHPDLEGQILATQDFTGSPYGAHDVQSHGTHCAGVIAARENDKGMVGVCPDLGQEGGGLIVGKVLGDDGSGRSSWVADGIHWSLSQGAQIISMSLGLAHPDAGILTAVDNAVREGALVIAAAGNDGGGGSSLDRVHYPARHRNTIAVGAVGNDKLIADFSSRGPAVDIAAPGHNILSTVPGGRYVRMSGTSMATPFVSAVVGLAHSRDEIGSTDELRDLLYKHAQDVGRPGKDRDYGAGLIRPDAMLKDHVVREPDAKTGVLLWIPGAEVR